MCLEIVRENISGFPLSSMSLGIENDVHLRGAFMKPGDTGDRRRTGEDEGAKARRALVDGSRPTQTDKPVAGDRAAASRQTDVVVVREVRQLLVSGESVHLSEIHRAVGGKEKPARCDWTTGYHEMQWWSVVEGKDLKVQSATTESDPVSQKVRDGAAELLEQKTFRERYEREPGLVRVAFDIQTQTTTLSYGDTSFVEERTKMRFFWEETSYENFPSRTGAHVVPVVAERVGQRVEKHMVLLERGGNVHNPGTYCGVLEGISYKDGIPPDPRQTAIRGLAEELGVGTRDIETLRFTNIGGNAGGIFDPIGYVRLDLTREQLLERWDQAPDKGENAQVLFVPLEINTVLKELMPWPSETEPKKWGATTRHMMIKLLVEEYGENAVKRSIERRHEQQTR